MAYTPKGFTKGVSIQNETDRSKQLLIDVDASSTTNTTTTLKSKQTANRTLELPNVSGELVEKDASQVLTGKTIDADLNTISNIENADIKTSAAIDATKISDGSVDNTEYGYLSGVTSPIQTQLSDLQSDAIKKDGSVAFTADQSMGGFKLTNLADPTNNQEAATKAYVDSFGGGEVNTGANVGSGTGLIFRDKTGVTLNFKSLIAGSNVTITNNANDITIASTSGGNTFSSIDLLGSNNVNYVTLSAPSSLSSNYSLTLPLNDGDSNQVLTTDGIGTLSWTNKSAENRFLSASSNNFDTNSTSYVDVTNLSITITTTGRPVMLMLVADGSINPSNVGITSGLISGAFTNSAVFKFVRNSTDIAIQQVELTGQVTFSGISNLVPPSSISFFDTPVAGTYTYKLQARSPSGGLFSARVFYCKLLAYEL